MQVDATSDMFSEEELFLAYRKAKADMFFERSIPNARKFALYEDDLEGNLRRLQSRLRMESKKPWFNDSKFIGNVSFVPKKLKPPEEEINSPNFYSSNAEDNWNRIFELINGNNDQRLDVEFRPMADFSVDMLIVSALWVNHVGEKLDASLDNSALGSRLRRITGTKSYHRTVWQSFEPYFRSYKKWRDDGFATIRSEISAGRKVVALTMDFSRYFHKIDPRFLLEKSFQDLLTKTGSREPTFTTTPTEFTESLVSAFETWGRNVPGYSKEMPVGLPVGATASRIIANVLLLEFDRLIQSELTPLYYARYVDDIFLVMRDTGHFRNAMSVMNWIVRRMQGVIGAGDANVLKVRMSYGGKSEIEFQKDKQRVFLIDNSDLLDAIESNVNEVSSEWRLLPDLKQIERSAAARTLSTSRDGNSEGDSLRKTDSLLLKRLGFAILLRNADATADAIPPKEWQSERFEFYEFALRHVVAPGKLFELADYLPRLISLAVVCRDWAYAEKIVSTVFRILSQIREKASLFYMNVKQPKPIARKIWDGFFKHQRLAFEEALLKSMKTTGSKRDTARCRQLYGQICAYWPEFQDLIPQEIELSQKLFCRDLGRNPFKAFLLADCRVATNFAARVPSNLPASFSERQTQIKEILFEVGHGTVSTMPLLFPTRPLGPEDLSILCPNRAADINKLKSALNAVRGTLYIDTPSNIRPKTRVITIGRGRMKEPPCIAVTSLLTSFESWCAAAGNKPDLSAARFGRISELCNAILKSPINTRPKYVLFPESSIPGRWMRTVAEALLRSRISIIAGEEYQHHRNNPTMVDSAARLFLTDNRLGYPSWCLLTQVKGTPAHHERDELRRRFGLTLQPSKPQLARKMIFNHFGFRFGILICSELTNMKHRLAFRGKIDALFVLSWNQDLESFGALVDASALDVHCYVALVNNRRFGDSRVRAPYKDQWLRDAVRVKGGLADYFVVAELDINGLRDFQSHAEPPEAPFKPFPEGFTIATRRRVTPGAKGT